VETVETGEGQLQRKHTDTIRWNGDSDGYESAEVTKTVTNPAGTNEVIVRIEIQLPKSIVGDSLIGSPHSINDAGYQRVEDRINSIVKDELSEIGPVPQLRFGNAGTTMMESLEYYDEIEVR
jgi:hypothetical protein